MELNKLCLLIDIVEQKQQAHIQHLEGLVLYSQTRLTVVVERLSLNRFGLLITFQLVDDEASSARQDLLIPQQVWCVCPSPASTLQFQHSVIPHGSYSLSQVLPIYYGAKSRQKLTFPFSITLKHEVLRYSLKYTAIIGSQHQV